MSASALAITQSYFAPNCEPGQSETIFFLPVRCSFAVAVAAGGLGTARIFQIDFSYFV